MSKVLESVIIILVVVSSIVAVKYVVTNHAAVKIGIVKAILN